jgi:hypothetical protein
VPDFSTKPTPPTRSVGGVGCLKHRNKTEDSGGSGSEKLTNDNPSAG